MSWPLSFLSLMTTVLGLIVSNNVSAGGYDGNWRTYDTSKEIIETAGQRASWYQYTEKREGYAMPVTMDDFFANADKTRGVVVHAHGCAGIGLAELAMQTFYESLGYHFIMQNFLTRGDATSSCPSGKPSATGFKETINPNRHLARRLELDYIIGMLQSKGFDNIIVTGHSEGGKTVQSIKSKVNGIIVHCMDGKSKNLWRPNPDNKYLFLYSVNDPWITGKGAYATYSAITPANKHRVFEHVSTIKFHGPFDEPAWENTIVKFLNGNLG